MRTPWLVTCVCGGVLLITKSLYASDPPASFDFARIETAVLQDGVPSVVERLGDSNKRLAAALTHVQLFLEHDKQQLWFQLQARTRLTGWEDFQAELRKQTPDETLIALSSELAMFEASRRFSDADAGPNVKIPKPLTQTWPVAPLPMEPTVRQRAISPNGAWEAQFSGRRIDVQQVSSGRILTIELSDADFDSLGEIASIALNTTNGTAAIGGQEAVLHLQLSTKRTKLVKLDVSRIPRDPIGRRFAARNGGKIPRLRVVITPDTKHAVVWSRKAVASFHPVTGACEFVLPVDVRHFGGRYGFLSGERIAINYQGFGRGGRIDGIRVFDLARGNQVINLEHGASQVGIAINTKTDTIATSGRVRHGYGPGNSKLVFWNANTGERAEQELPDMYGNVVGITEDGERLLTLALRPGVVFVWDMATRKLVRRFDLGIDLSRGRLDGSTLVLRGSHPNEAKEYWFKYHRSK